MAILKLLNTSKVNFDGDPKPDIKVNKNMYTAIVREEADIDHVFIIPQKYDFITVQVHTLEGESTVDYTASDIQVFPAPNGSTDTCIKADWMSSDIIKDVALGETKIEGVEFMVTAVRVRTTGKCRAVVTVKDGN